MLRFDQVISVRLLGKPVNITITQVYAPTTESKGDKIKSFYISIKEEIEHTLKQYMLIIIGEWNTKVENKQESYVIGKFRLGVRNKAGDQLVDFYEAKLVHHKHML